MREYGGIYLDFDTLVLRSFEPLRHFTFNLGRQATIGLINAIMIGEKSSRFLEAWYYSYRYVDFRCWDCHSVRLPCQLAQNYPHIINILSEQALLCPYHRGVLYENEVQPAEMYCTVYPFEGKYAQHLWHHTIKGRRYLHGLTVPDVCSGNSLYHRMLRFAINSSTWFKEHCTGSQLTEIGSTSTTTK